MKAEIVTTEKFQPIEIKIVLESLEETEKFYNAIGQLPISWPTDAVYNELGDRFSFE